MLNQRRRGLIDVIQMLYKCFVFTGIYVRQVSEHCTKNPRIYRPQDKSIYVRVAVVSNQILLIFEIGEFMGWALDWAPQ